MNKDEYVDLPKQLTKPLFDVMMRYPLLEYGQRRFEEKQFDKIDDGITVSINPKGQTPYFTLNFKGTSCRFSLGGQECEPIGEVPREIDRHRNEINEWYRQNRRRFIEFYNESLPDTAPAQARIRSI